MSGADAPQRTGGHSGRLDVDKPTPGTRCGASAHWRVVPGRRGPRHPSRWPALCPRGRQVRISIACSRSAVQPPARRGSPAAARRRHRPFRAGAEFGSGDGGGGPPVQGRTDPGSADDEDQPGAHGRPGAGPGTSQTPSGGPGGARPPEHPRQPSERRRPVPMRPPAAPARPIGPLRAGPPRERGPRSDVHEYRKRPPPVNPDPDHDALLPSVWRGGLSACWQACQAPLIRTAPGWPKAIAKRRQDVFERLAAPRRAKDVGALDWADQWGTVPGQQK